MSIKCMGAFLMSLQKNFFTSRMIWASSDSPGTTGGTCLWHLLKNLIMFHSALMFASITFLFSTKQLTKVDEEENSVVYYWEINWPRFFSNRDYCCHRSVQVNRNPFLFWSTWLSTVTCRLTQRLARWLASHHQQNTLLAKDQGGWSGLVCSISVKY